MGEMGCFVIFLMLVGWNKECLIQRMLQFDKDALLL